MEAIFNNVEFWQVIGYVLGVSLATGIVALVAPYVARRGKEVVYYIRKYEPELIAAVDEPGDPFNLQIDRWLDKLIPADWNRYSALMFPALLRAAADAFDKALDIPDAAEVIGDSQ